MTSPYISEKARNKARILPKESVLVTCIGIIGKVAVNKVECAFNQQINAIIPSTEKCSASYLAYSIQYNKPKLQDIANAPVVPILNKTQFSNLRIRLCSLSEQEKITQILDKVTDLISLRKQQLAKLDGLVKSRFIEMFGDTTSNPMKWKKVLLNTVCDVRDGTHDSPNYYSEGVPLVTSKNVTGGKIDLSDCNLISKEDFVKICKRSKVDLGDIIMPMIGTVGKPVIVDIEPAFAIKNVALIKFHKQVKVLNLTARAVFSTYQTMMNCIDDSKDEDGGKLFTVGHFDLIIVDEAHRSIYRKYRDIFTYFDALLVGLTATPRDEIDKNTYSIFELENGVPTYGYELEQAVQDKFLVDFMALETTLKFPSQGIHYDDLTEEEREEYEDSFADEEGNTPDEIGCTAINDWVFNEDTIRKVLNILMTQGIRVDYGNKLGKTILFAANHRHAEEIYRIFGQEYPAYHDYAKVIDNYTNYAQSAIDEFSEPNKMPQIAISVDMLDTGIDVPEVVNLVFFKKVRSRAKFWQMIGRGTRLCPGLLDGEDKKQFYIFDFCNNFEFFRMHPKGKNGTVQESLQERLFNLKANIALKLQDLKYQTEELRAFRKELVADMAFKIKELPRDNFAVCQHLKFVDLYSNEDAFTTLSYENTLQLADEVAPLLLPYEDDASALRFDSLLYGIELASLVNNTCKKARRDLLCKVQAIAGVANIPQINAQSELLNELLHTDYLENADIPGFEHIRAELRDLVKYIPFKDRTFVNIDLKDEILASEWKTPDLENDDLKNYKLKVNYYIRQNQDERAISKLKTNKPLTSDDIRDLEKILWSDLGTKQDYEREFGAKPLGELVREIVGLDMVAAKAAFSHYLNDTNLDSRQIYFVNQIVNYIVQNGVMKDLSVLQQPPFNDNGSFAEFFDTAIILDLRKIIDSINRNAAA